MLMLEYMQNRCDDTGNLTKKDTKKKIAGKGCANNHIFLSKTKEKKGGEKSGTGSTGLQTSIYLLFEDVN